MTMTEMEEKLEQAKRLLREIAAEASNQPAHQRASEIIFAVRMHALPALEKLGL